MVVSKYSIQPFSGPNWKKNDARATKLGLEELGCAICGKPVKEVRFSAIVVGGGAAWGDMGSDSEDPGYMGTWNIGADCHRKYVISKETA